MYFLLLLLWMIFNGRVTLEVFLFGVVICGWLYWFISKYMGYNYKDEIRYAKKIPLYLKYAVVLVWEIIKANIDVIKIILSPNMEIEPAIVKFRTDLESDAARVTLANSITLTPGTYTAGLENGDFVVQALDKSKFGEGLDDSVFVKQLRRLEGRK
ncbi:MAG: Na+/H+ antiporter subunit E [Anaerotignum sp.]|nr:Na+/H+ antiporter subunit E [Anaerotignum sp.]